MTTLWDDDEDWRDRERREGERLRDEGIALVSSSPVDDDWAGDAERWIARLPVGALFTAAELTHAVGMPKRRNRVGATIRGIAQRTGMIAKVGTVNSATATRHAAVVAEWRRLGPGVQAPPAPRADVVAARKTALREAYDLVADPALIRQDILDRLTTLIERNPA